jgi:hypothetical protein
MVYGLTALYKSANWTYGSLQKYKLDLRFFTKVQIGLTALYKSTLGLTALYIRNFSVLFLFRKILKFKYFSNKTELLHSE